MVPVLQSNLALVNTATDPTSGIETLNLFIQYILLIINCLIIESVLIAGCKRGPDFVSSLPKQTVVTNTNTDLVLPEVDGGSNIQDKLPHRDPSYSFPVAGY